jgi:Homeodomain-like domain
MARGRKSPCTIFLAPTERAELEPWQRSTTIQAGLARRAKLILLRADGLALSDIARRLGMGRRIVRKWLRSFINNRVPGLSDQPSRGRQPVCSPRRGGVSGQTGRRATGYARPVPLPVGLRRAGPPTGTGGARRV